MKKAEFEKLSDEDLKNRIVEISSELSAARMKNRLGQFKKTSEFGRIRKEVARIKTVLRQRELNTETTKGAA